MLRLLPGLLLLPGCVLPRAGRDAGVPEPAAAAEAPPTAVEAAAAAPNADPALPPPEDEGSPEPAEEPSSRAPDPLPPPPEDPKALLTWLPEAWARQGLEPAGEQGWLLHVPLVQVRSSSGPLRLEFRDRCLALLPGRDFQAASWEPDEHALLEAEAVIVRAVTASPPEDGAPDPDLTGRAVFLEVREDTEAASWCPALESRGARAVFLVPATAGVDEILWEAAGTWLGEERLLLQDPQRLPRPLRGVLRREAFERMLLELRAAGGGAFSLRLDLDQQAEWTSEHAVLGRIPGRRPEEAPLLLRVAREATGSAAATAALLAELGAWLQTEPPERPVLLLWEPAEESVRAWLSAQAGSWDCALQVTLARLEPPGPGGADLRLDPDLGAARLADLLRALADPGLRVERPGPPGA